MESFKDVQVRALMVEDLPAGAEVGTLVWLNDSLLIKCDSRNWIPVRTWVS